MASYKLVPSWCLPTDGARIATTPSRRWNKRGALMRLMVIFAINLDLLLPCEGFKPGHSSGQLLQQHQPRQTIRMSSVSGNEETVTRDAIESMEECYKSVGASALIDLADFLYNSKQKDLFSVASRIDLMRISTKATFFLGLFLAGRLVKDLPATSASEDSIIKALAIMKNLWFYTAIFVVLGSGLNASRLFNLNLKDRIVATCCVLFAMGVRVYSLKDIKQQLSADSALQDHGTSTVRSMSFCASALI